MVGSDYDFDYETGTWKPLSSSIASITARLEARLTRRLIDQIRLLLARRPPAVQGAVLGDLVAWWLAGIPLEARADAIDMWLAALPRMIEAEANKAGDEGRAAG